VANRHAHDPKISPRTADIVARGTHIPFFNEVVEVCTRAHTVEQVVKEAERLGFVAAPILDFGEVAREPHSSRARASRR
jgi:crotonobetainyl-CoA:carnitine CoA-transferase CaiB-like acyl-CoA transferase